MSTGVTCLTATKIMVSSRCDTRANTDCTNSLNDFVGGIRVHLKKKLVDGACPSTHVHSTSFSAHMRSSHDLVDRKMHEDPRVQENRKHLTETAVLSSAALLHRDLAFWRNVTERLLTDASQDRFIGWLWSVILSCRGVNKLQFCDPVEFANVNGRNAIVNSGHVGILMCLFPPCTRAGHEEMLYALILLPQCTCTPSCTRHGSEMSRGPFMIKQTCM